MGRGDKEMWGGEKDGREMTREEAGESGEREDKERNTGGLGEEWQEEDHRAREERRMIL